MHADNLSQYFKESVSWAVVGVKQLSIFKQVRQQFVTFIISFIVIIHGLEIKDKNQYIINVHYFHFSSILICKVNKH